MSYFIICGTAFVVAGLTLFSGFGLGTLLMPVFAIFFRIEIAVAATAIVHLANNLFKVFLLAKHADKNMVMRFAIPAAIAAAAGAMLLGGLSAIAPVYTYEIAGRVCSVTWLKMTVGLVIMCFALIELSPATEKLSFETKYIPLGGIISGFFGGLSGHQGALRTAFLVRAGLSKEAFVGTTVISAVIVDVTRLMIYGLTFFSRDFDALKTQGVSGLVLAGTIAAFAGSFIGTRILEKITMKTLQKIVGIMLLALSIALGVGMV